MVPMGSVRSRGRGWGGNVTLYLLLPPSCHPPHPHHKSALAALFYTLAARKPVCRSPGGPWNTKQACGVGETGLGHSLQRRDLPSR